MDGGTGMMLGDLFHYLSILCAMVAVFAFVMVLRQ
jgi:hypothetical protein